MKGRGVLSVGLAVMLVIEGLALLALSDSRLLPSAEAQLVDEVLPEDLVRGFYGWYLGAIDLEGGSNPLVDRSYRSSEFLSGDFVAEVDALLDSFEAGGYDPFLLAQDVPDSIEVGEALVAGDAAQVHVQTSFSGHGFLVYLTQMDGTWKIDDVVPTPDVIARSFYERYLAYIRNDRGMMRSPLVDGFYRGRPELSDSFVAELDAALAFFDKGGADPILLAQDVPVEIVVGEAELMGDRALVPLEMFWAGNPEPAARLVTVERIDRRWQIQDVALD